MPDEDPEIIHSPLERAITQSSASVTIYIYRGEHEITWLLEVEGDDGTSTVWDDRFDTDQAALDEAMRAIDEDGLTSFRTEATGS